MYHAVRLYEVRHLGLATHCACVWKLESQKRGGDTANKCFKSTELIAGVKDMRFQALMPDVLDRNSRLDNRIVFPKRQALKRR